MNYIDIAANVRKGLIRSLVPGDKFFYQNVYYIVIDFKPSDCFISAIMQDIAIALDTATYKIIGFDPNTEVDILDSISF